MSFPEKKRGFARLFPAFLFSLQGLRQAWPEPAFVFESWIALVLYPLAFFIGNTWLEVSVLCASVTAVLVVELLNTSIESAIDRVGPQWHPLSKRSKDLGSAAVFLSLLLCACIWLAAVFSSLRAHYFY